MKKQILSITMIMTLVLCFSCGAFAAAIPGDPNQYKVSDAISNGDIDTENLYIGTVGDWKKGSTNFPNTQNRKTFFENGEALNDDDIIITNGVVGSVISVGTRNPWGYPSGSILDAGTVDNKTANRDTTWSIEFLVHGWDGWAPNNCGIVDFSIVEYDFDKTSPTFKKEVAGKTKAVKVSRKYTVNGKDLDIVTYYGVDAGKNHIYMFDSIKNNGKDIDMLNNRFSMTNKGDDGGSMADLNSATTSYGNIDGKPYNITYALPGKNTSSENIDHKWSKNGGSLGYKELRSHMAYKAGESVTFDEYIIIDDSPSLESYYAFKNAYDEKTVQKVSGTVTDSDNANVPNPVIVVKETKDGKDSIYGWFVGDASGNYSIDLPKGEYKLFVESNGFSPSADQAVTVDAANVIKEIKSGDKKVKVTFNVKDSKGNPLWAKVELFKADGKSAYPTVRYTGESVYLANDTANKGKIEAQIIPGDYTAVVYAEGYWFYSEPQKITGNTAKTSVDVTINKPYSAPAGWLSGDLHHHANKNDAFSDPVDAIPSMAAAGLDVAFVSDHDFTVNNQKAFELSSDYKLKGYIPSEEISCSWAHFNVIPQNKEAYDFFQDSTQKNNVIDQFGNLPDFIKETHDKGASITANHPWQSYGLFFGYDVDSIPGGYTDDYDSLEINACCADEENAFVIMDTAALWTSFQDGTSIYKTKKSGGDAVKTKKTHYLVGGSDTHDVKINDFATDDYKNSRSKGLYASGKVRTMVYTGKEASTITDTGLDFAKATVNGNSYVTFGPTLSMDKTPGNDLSGNPIYYEAENNFNVNIGVNSINKIKDVLVLTKDSKDAYGNTGIVYDKSLSKLNVNSNVVDNCRIKVPVAKGEKTWVAVMVYDVDGNYAITNPWWVQQNNNKNFFSDVNADMWYAPYINALAKEKIVQGYEDGTFKPEGKITRAEFVTMIAPIIPKTTEKEVSFSDVKKGSWYYNNVMKVAKYGYINGYENGTFKPDALITRAEIAKIIYEASGLKASTKVDIFTDVPTNQWYAVSINTLADNGYVNGNGDGTFAPNDQAIRGAAAKNIYVYEHNGAVLLNKVIE